MSDSEIFRKINFNIQKLEEEYSETVFEDCDFSNMKIIVKNFESCEFKRCNFSLVKFYSNLREVAFTECKMVGADFTGIGAFSGMLRFQKGVLDYASFAGLKLHKTIFELCHMEEVNFNSADITGSDFNECELYRLTFHGTNLENVDFSRSYNFSIDPNLCRLKKTVFSANSLRGLVSHLDIELKEL